MGSDVISLAFQWDCDEFLQRVFLQLNPHTLKTSRTVSIEKQQRKENKLGFCRSAHNGMSILQTECGKVPMVKNNFRGG